jgi:hypothetical protein
MLVSKLSQIIRMFTLQMYIRLLTLYVGTKDEVVI